MTLSNLQAKIERKKEKYREDERTMELLELIDNLRQCLDDLRAKLVPTVDAMVLTDERLHSLERQLANIPTGTPYVNPEGR
jgi:uncharacterized coiled-coil DUF342 family protein